MSGSTGRLVLVLLSMACAGFVALNVYLLFNGGGPLNAMSAGICAFSCVYTLKVSLDLR